jgi:hypothetical protein
MRDRRSRVLHACAIVLPLLTACGGRAETPPATAPAPAAGAESAPPALSMGGAKSVTRFFVTSRGLGRGGDLGGLAGADAHCQALANAEGSGDHTWRAYLSTTGTSTTPAVNARDRVGTGPWYNALGDRVALNLGELHGGRSLTPENVVTERGDPVSGVAEIFTGSRADGTAFSETDDRTCRNWTSSNGGHAQVGRVPSGQATETSSWNSAHASRDCTQQEPQTAGGGGGGLFYCFAID